MAVADKGRPHFAVKVGDVVFENLRKEGVPFAQWLEEMGVNLGDSGGRYATVEVINF